jgi:hypothetical protein
MQVGEITSLMHFLAEERLALQDRGLITLAQKEYDLVLRLHET